MSPDDVISYKQYLERFGRLVGAMQTGQYGHYRSRLVCKLGAGDYGTKAREYLELGERFVQMVAAGDTIDDVLAVELRAAEVDLLLERSLYLPHRGA